MGLPINSDVSDVSDTCFGIIARENTNSFKMLNYYFYMEKISKVASLASLVSLEARRTSRCA